MFLNGVVGQDELKGKLFSSLKEEQVPHSQCFIDNSGRGGLHLAVAFALELLWDVKQVEKYQRDKKDTSFFWNSRYCAYNLSFNNKYSFISFRNPR